MKNKIHGRVRADLSCTMAHCNQVGGCVVWQESGTCVRESIFSKSHTNEFCGKSKAAHERCVAGAPHPSARRIYESGRPNWVWKQFQHSDGACTPGILSDRQPLCDSSGGFEEILTRRGPRSGRRLPRNRLLRLHGVLELLRGGMGSRLLPPKNGFCG